MCPTRPLLKKFFPLRAVFVALGLAFSFGGLGGASAQTPSPTPETSQRGVWTAELPGGTYIVMLSAITSISQHEYVVDGAARVTEVNINTLGPVVARFYYIEPNTPQNPNGIGQSGVDLLEAKANEALARVGGEELSTRVMKSYPTTTHAGTVEYRLTSLESLEKLFQSARRSWLRKKPGKFKP